MIYKIIIFNTLTWLTISRHRSELFFCYCYLDSEIRNLEHLFEDLSSNFKIEFSFFNFNFNYRIGSGHFNRKIDWHSENRSIFQIYLMSSTYAMLGSMLDQHCCCIDSICYIRGCRWLYYLIKFRIIEKLTIFFKDSINYGFI